MVAPLEAARGDSPQPGRGPPAQRDPAGRGALAAGGGRTDRFAGLHPRPVLDGLPSGIRSVDAAGHGRPRLPAPGGLAAPPPAAAPADAGALHVGLDHRDRPDLLPGQPCDSGPHHQRRGIGLLHAQRRRPSQHSPADGRRAVGLVGFIGAVGDPGGIRQALRGTRPERPGAAGDHLPSGRRADPRLRGPEERGHRRGAGRPGGGGAQAHRRGLALRRHDRPHHRNRLGEPDRGPVPGAPLRRRHRHRRRPVLLPALGRAVHRRHRQGAGLGQGAGESRRRLVEDPSRGRPPPTPAVRGIARRDRGRGGLLRPGRRRGQRRRRPLGGAAQLLSTVARSGRPSRPGHQRGGPHLLGGDDSPLRPGQQSTAVLRRGRHLGRQPHPLHPAPQRSGGVVVPPAHSRPSARLAAGDGGRRPLPRHALDALHHLTSRSAPTCHGPRMSPTATGTTTAPRSWTDSP